MGKKEKKTGKGRLDKYYYLAKEQGYRSRAAFKLVQLNKKYNFLANSKVLIDLCAAPGGWLQVAAKVMPVSSLIVGVDLVPIKPIANCITFAEDIASDKCRAKLRQHLKTWKADTVLHDGAPNVGTAWLQDAYSQAVLVLMALKLATEFLMPGGTFVTKVFRSKDYNKLMWVFNQLFTKVEATKPPASRNVSAEIFVVCRGYKAPQKLDPKFLDPRAVFEEVPDQAPNAEAKVFHPEKRKRYREGYEDGDYTFYKEATAMEFVETQDPIQILSATTRITWTDEASRRLCAKDVTTKEIMACAEDLKLLGKKDFRNLLKWRLAVREELGLTTMTKMKNVEEEGPKETVTITEDDQIDAEMERSAAQDQANRKRVRRKLNERKRKEILRMQMGMLTPHELGLEQDAMDADEIFGLKTAEKNGAMQGLLGGVMPEESEDEQVDNELDDGQDSAGEIDDLEQELDAMYNRYQERKVEASAKYRAKRAREEVEEWDGITNNETVNGDPSGSQSDSESEEEEMLDPVDSLLTTLGPRLDARSKGQMSKRAALFFDRPEFEGLGLDGMERSGPEESPEQQADAIGVVDGEEMEHDKDVEMKDSASEDDYEEVPADDGEQDAWDADSDEEKAPAKSTIDIVTAEAMTLAHQLATRQKTKASMIDDSYNRWTFSETANLPAWFADDEARHNTPQQPITAAAAEAIKAKLRALNARPIKKVAEAKARKKLKAIRKLNKLQKKADVINENAELTENDKVGAIAKLMAKARGRGAAKKRNVQVVVAHGKNRGIQGRPKGIKGRYKMVDPRMKKEKRALKRAGKKSR